LDRLVLLVHQALLEPLEVQDQQETLDSLVYRVILVHLVIRVDLVVEGRLVLLVTQDRLDHLVHLVLSDYEALKVFLVVEGLLVPLVQLASQVLWVQQAHQVQLELLVWLEQLEFQASEGSLEELVPVDSPVPRDELAASVSLLPSRNFVFRCKVSFLMLNVSLKFYSDLNR